MGGASIMGRGLPEQVQQINRHLDVSSLFFNPNIQGLSTVLAFLREKSKNLETKNCE